MNFPSFLSPLLCRTLAIAAVSLLAASSMQAQNAVRPLVLNGYNQDVIAEGVYEDASSVQQTTSTAIDTSFDYYAPKFNPKASNVGLPAGDTFVSASNPNATFLLQAADNNNVLLLTDQSSGVSVGTLTLAYPGSFTALAVLVTGLDSSNPVGYTLNFADAGAPVSGSFVAPDNFSGSGAVARSGFGRVRRSGGIDSDSHTKNQPRLYEIDIPLSALNAKRQLTSIDFVNRSPGRTSNNLERKIAIFAVSGASSVQNLLSPIPLTGFTQDVIAEGGNARTSTSIALDGVNAFYALGFNPKAANVGLPAGGKFVSAANPNASFLLQSAAGPNALLLTDQSEAASQGTLLLTIPASYSALAILATGLNGANPVNYTLNFSDGGSPTQGQFVASDNFSGGSPVALAGFGRVNRGANAIDNSQNDGKPRLYEIDIPLSAADARRRLTSVTFANQATQPTEDDFGRNVAVFGLSGGAVRVNAGQAAFSSAGYTVLNNAGNAEIAVKRVGGSGGTLSVNYASVDGTAKAGMDYQAVSGTLTWADGDAAPKKITAPIVANASAQSAVAALLNLSPANGAAQDTVGVPSQAALIILKTTAAPIQGVFLLSPPTGITVVQNQLVELYVNVEATESAYKQVEFFVADASAPDSPGLSLGTSTALRDKKSWVPSQPGNFVLKAVATDINGGSKVATEPIAVAPAASATDAGPQVALQGDLENRQFALGDSVTLVASAVDANGAPLQSVQFYADGVPIGAPVIPQASAAQAGGPGRKEGFTTDAVLAKITATLQKQVQLITATGKDKDGRSAISPGRMVFAKVGKGGAACAIASPSPLTTLPANALDQTVDVTASATNGPVAKVELFYGSTSVKILTAPPYRFTLPPLAAGAYALTAVATDANGVDTTSEAVIVNVVGSTLPVISVEATVPQAVAGSGESAEFTISRTGDLTQEVVVAYAVKGSAAAGVNYVALKGTKKMKAGKESVKIKIVPLEGGTAPGATKAVKLVLQANGAYTISGAGTAKVKIVGGD
jgi:hypothetical protein